MKKLALLLALVFAAPAFAEPAMLPSHAVQGMVLTINPTISIEALAYTATTTYPGTNRFTATVTTTLGTESAPTATNTTAGIDLTGIEFIRVRLVTSSAATAGGKLEAYLKNSFDNNWDRYPAWDLTTAALTRQTWAPISIGVRTGRAMWVPAAIGSVTGTMYLEAQSK
jgi:hypothetical protein